MKLTKRGDVWQVDFDNLEGTRVRVSTGVKVNRHADDEGKGLAMLAAIDKMRAHLDDTAPLAEVRKHTKKHVTLRYALERTWADNWSGQKDAGLHYKIAKLSRDIGYWPLHTITYNRLLTYCKELETAKRPVSPTTRNRYMSLIHTAMGHAKRRSELDELPEFPHWPENNIKERYLTREEERALIAYIAEHSAPADNVARYLIHLTIFLLDTGLRTGEVSMEPAQDLGERVWLPHGTTKSNKGRTVPLTTRARAALDEMLASPVHAELRRLRAIHHYQPTKFLSTRYIPWCEKAGFDDVGLHTLRHTCASRLVQAGVSLYVVKEWLGHSSITITERYAHLAPKNLDAAAAALEDVTPGVPKAFVAPKLQTPCGADTLLEGKHEGDQ